VWQSNQVVLAALNSSLGVRGWQCIKSGKPGDWRALKTEDGGTAETELPAIVVSPGTHVLIDDYMLDLNLSNASERRHRPQKDETNPILRETQDWENRMHMFGSVVQVSSSELRIYYVIDGVYGLYTCMAVSLNSGRTWLKPNLGLFGFGKNNSTQNNIVFATPPGSGKRAADAPMGQDWLGFVGLNGDPAAVLSPQAFVATMSRPSWLVHGPSNCSGGKYILTSPDGLRFNTSVSDDCFLTHPDDTQNVIVYDSHRRSQLMFNRIDERPSLNDLKHHCPCNDDPPERKVAVAQLFSITTPPRAGKWPARQIALNYDLATRPCPTLPENCTDLYSNAANAYEDTFVLLPTAFSHWRGIGRYPDGQPVVSDGPMWTRLAVARDALGDFSYVNNDRSPWIPRGSGSFNWTVRL
jgi:hypothetical protein